MEYIIPFKLLHVENQEIYHDGVMGSALRESLASDRQSANEMRKKSWGEIGYDLRGCVSY